MLGQPGPSLPLLTADLDAVFDYIQQTVSTFRAQRCHTVLIYVNEIYSPFTLCQADLLKLKNLIFISMKKNGLFWK